jgi:NADH dehydrogenase
MERAGVTMKLNARVMLATGEGVGLKDDFVRGGTIVCTIGTTISPVVDRLASPKEKGRLLTEPDLRLRGRVDAWAIGDCACIINAHDQQPSPPTGQFAERQGRQCAENILRVLGGQPTRPFSFKVLGQLCSIGGHCAVAEMFGFRLSGFWAWFAWRGVYLFKLPSWSRRVQVGFDWAWLVIFPRDLSHLKTDVTDRISHAHYEPGDYVIRQGEAPSSFYVIEKGEVEIVRVAPESPEGEVIAVIGPGNFFGEAALINNQPRGASVRARTALEVVVMGRHVFSTISKSLAPLRSALTAAITRRAPSYWQQQPAIMAALRDAVLADYLEPIPQPLLKPTDTLTEVTRVFGRHSPEFFFVSADGMKLDGIVTLTDILRAQGSPAETPAADFMAKTPVAITATDTCLVAAAAFREHGLKFLPVVTDKQSLRLVGFIRARQLLTGVLQQTAPISTPSGRA